MPGLIVMRKAGLQDSRTWTKLSTRVFWSSGQNSSSGKAKVLAGLMQLIKCIILRSTIFINYLPKWKVKLKVIPRKIAFLGPKVLRKIKEKTFCLPTPVA
jgi:hypothetical protein